MTPLYKDLIIESSKFNEDNDCAVVGIAAVCNVSYIKAHEALRIQGRKQGKGASRLQQEQAIKMIGGEYANLGKPTKANGGGYTTKSIGKAFPTGRYLVHLNRHVAALTDGEINDWTQGSTHRVLSIAKITPAKITPKTAPAAKRNVSVKAGVRVWNLTNGEVVHFTSVLKAFEALGLNVKKHKKFRFELKRSVNLTATFETFKFEAFGK